MGNGEMATGAILCAVAAALGWSYLASLWASGLENCLPFLFVVLALAAASGWNFLGLGSNGSLSDGAASTGRHQLPGQGGHSPGLPPATLSPSQQRRRAEERPGARQQPSLPPPLQQQAQGQGQEAQLRRARRGSSTRPLLEAAGQEVELARMGGVSRPGSRRVVTAVPGNGSAGSSKSASSQTLMPDHSVVLVQAASFSCPKPLGCGFRHACPDTQRSWMACDKHRQHPAPPEGSVWREAVPDGQPSAGSHRLLLAWDGRVLDATDLGQCRGWDRQLTDISAALLDSGTRAGGMCSQSHRFPRLEKSGELLRMDPRAAARGRQLWGVFERWLGRQQKARAVPLAAIAGAPESS